MSELQHLKYLKKKLEKKQPSDDDSLFTKFNNQNQLYKLFMYNMTKNIKPFKTGRKLILINDNINLLNLLYNKLEKKEEVNDDDINNYNNESKTYNNESFKKFLITELNTQLDIETKIGLIKKISKSHQSIKYNLEKIINDNNLINLNSELDEKEKEITKSMSNYITNEIESMMKSISNINYIKQNNIKFTLYDKNGRYYDYHWDTKERINQFKTASYHIYIDVSKFYDLSCYVYIKFNNKTYIFNVIGNNSNLKEDEKDYTLLSLYKNKYDIYIVTNIRVLLLNLIICLTSNQYYRINDYTILRGLLNKDLYENYQSLNNYIIPAFIKDFKKYGIYNIDNKEEEEEEEELINLLLIPNYLEYLNNINSYIENEINLYSNLWIDEKPKYIPLNLLEPSFYKKLHVPLNLTDLKLDKKDIILEIDKKMNMTTEFYLLLENQQQQVEDDEFTSLFQDESIKGYIKEKEEELKEIKENIDNAQTNLETVKGLIDIKENYDVQKIINDSILKEQEEFLKQTSSSKESSISTSESSTTISNITKEETTSSSSPLIVYKKKEEEESILNSIKVVEHSNKYNDVDDFYRQLKKEYFK